MSTPPDGNTPRPATLKPGAALPSETTAFRADTKPQMGDTARVAAADWVGKAIGKYQVVGVLGQGGMGVVLKARDPLIEREVAIKVLPAHLASDAVSLQRFLAEAKSAGKLNHPNVVSIYEIGQQDDLCYLVLELVPGGSLDGVLASGQGLSVLEATRVIADACRGVAAAHAAGMIHRDIKPANFMRAADGSTKVADFGLAKAKSDSGRGLTQTGMVVGTPYFMSPEQCQAKPLDARSDIYSLGATYFSLLTGSHPYQECEGVTQLMYQHCHGPVPDPRALKGQVPDACSRIVAKAMAKAPADRYQSAEAMLADLQQVIAALSGQATIALPSDSQAHRAVGVSTPSRRGLWLTVGGVAVLAIGSALLMTRPKKEPGVAPAAAGEPIKIGVLHSLTGPMAASDAPIADAVNFAVNELNKTGGVLGRPVHIVPADGRSEPTVFADEARRLIVQEKVVALFGCWTSASRKNVKAVVEELDHVLFYPSAFEGLELSNCIIYMGAAPNQQILPTVDWAMSTLKKKKFYIVGSDSILPRAADAIVRDYVANKKGGQVVGTSFIPPGSYKVEPAIEAIKTAKPDIILSAISGETNAAFFRALRDAGIKSADVPTISLTVSEMGLGGLPTAAIAGDYAAWAYFQSIDTPSNRDFVQRFQAEYPQRRITDPMATSTIAVRLWADSVAEAQSTDPRTVRRSAQGRRVSGPTDEIWVDPASQYCSRTPRIAQIQPNREFKVVWSAAAPVKPEPFPATRKAEAWRAMLYDLYTGWGNRWSAETP